MPADQSSPARTWNGVERVEFVPGIRIKAIGGEQVCICHVVYEAGKQVPLPFSISYNPADVNPDHVYELNANISVNGKPMFVSTSHYPILTKGAPSTALLSTAPFRVTRRLSTLTSIRLPPSSGL